MIRTCVLCTMLALFSLSANAETENLALDVLEHVEKLKLDNLWPGFEPLEVAVALYDGQKTYLARHPNPPDAFSPLPGYKGIFCCEGRFPKVVANSTTVINDHRTATLLLNLNPDPCVESLAAIVVHESFHVHQWQNHEDWLADESVTFTYPIEDVSGLVLRRLEAQSLHKGVSSEDDLQAKAWVKGALALRKKRFARLTEAQRAYDRGFELLEGTAHYVENQSLQKASHQLAEEIEASDVRSRNYATGEALCVLLDRFVPGWKKRLEEGGRQDLDKLLEEALNDTEVSPCLPDQALITKMERKAEQDIERIVKARQADKEAFMNAEGWTLIIEVEEPAHIFWPAGFDPMNVARLDEKEVLHKRMLKLSGKAGSFEAMDRKTLTTAKGPHPLYNGIIRIVVTGIIDAPDIEENEGSHKISTPKIKAVLKNATMEKTGQKITVRL